VSFHKTERFAKKFQHDAGRAGEAFRSISVSSVLHGAEREATDVADSEAIGGGAEDFSGRTD